MAFGGDSGWSWSRCMCLPTFSFALKGGRGGRTSQETKEDIPNKQTRIQPDEGGEHIHMVEVLITLYVVVSKGGRGEESPKRQKKSLEEASLDIA